MNVKSKKYVLQALAEFPKSSKKAIATYLYETYPTLFSSIDVARSSIRYYTGARGEARLHNKVVDHQSEFSRENPFGLAKSKGKKRAFVHIDKDIRNALILSDIHFPNHDVEALTSALSYGKVHKVDCIILNGDILDNEPFTNHDASPPSNTDVRSWFEMVEDFLDMLIKEFAVPIYWLEGNHDNWYMRYLMKRAPVLFHDEYYTLSSRLKLKEKKIIWLGQNEILMLGKLAITHGHMIVKGFFSPVNPAKGVYNKLKSSMLIGHCHTTSEHSESTLSHELVTTYSTGCLCTLAPDYDPFNCKHNLGFARVEIEQNANYKVYNERIDYFTKQIY